MARTPGDCCRDCPSSGRCVCFPCSGDVDCAQGKTWCLCRADRPLALVPFDEVLAYFGLTSADLV